jgi:chromosome segregation ATPase
MKFARENIGKLESQLKDWEAKLDVLVAKAEVVRAEAKSDYREHIDELKTKHRLAKAKLEELKAEGNDKWDTLKSGVESAWNELENAFKKLKA